MPTAITIDGVSKHYPPPPRAKSGPTNAVDNVSLQIGAGQLFFLLGPSGCGKTTLLRMIAGFVQPNRGAIRFGDRDVTRTPPEKRNTGMVFQSYALWPHMSVEQNVAFGLGVRKISKDDRRERVREALAAVQMEAYAGRKPNQLSGGQQQRVALARALVIRPDVLLLDEPLSNLDAKLRLEMRAEIRRICKSAEITTIYVTHDQKEALSMADQIAVLNMGVVAQVGPPREVYARPKSRFVASFMGEANLIESKLIGLHNGRARIQLPAGEVASTLVGDLRATPSKILCAIRPESWVIHSSEGEGRLRGEVVDTIYLGEMAQHVVKLGGDLTVTVYEMSPRSARGVGGAVWLEARPDDVVLLPS